MIFNGSLPLHITVGDVLALVASDPAARHSLLYGDQVLVDAGRLLDVFDGPCAELTLVVHRIMTVPAKYIVIEDNRCFERRDGGTEAEYLCCSERTSSVNASGTFQCVPPGSYKVLAQVAIDPLLEPPRQPFQVVVAQDGRALGEFAWAPELAQRFLDSTVGKISVEEPGDVSVALRCTVTEGSVGGMLWRSLSLTPRFAV